MNTRIFLLLACFYFSFSVAYSQITIRGNITDASTSEPLIGATIIYGKGQGTVTDIDGNYKIEIPSGERKFQISYVGYEALNKEVFIKEKSQELNFKLI